jgi:hypothetical protein
LNSALEALAFRGLSAADGLSPAYLRLGLIADASVASSQAPLSGARVGALSLAILTQRIYDTYHTGRYGEALIGLDARARLAPRTDRPDDSARMVLLPPAALSRGRAGLPGFDGDRRQRRRQRLRDGQGAADERAGP